MYSMIVILAIFLPCACMFLVLPIYYIIQDKRYQKKHPDLQKYLAEWSKAKDEYSLTCENVDRLKKQIDDKLDYINKYAPKDKDIDYDNYKLEELRKELEQAEKEKNVAKAAYNTVNRNYTEYTRE